MLVVNILVIVFALVPAWARNPWYDNSEYVNEFHPMDLYELVRDKPDGLWMVQFYSGSDSNKEFLFTNYSIAAKSMMGHVKSAAINVDDFPFLHLVMELKRIPTYHFYGYYKHIPEKHRNLLTVDDLHERSSKELVHYFEERSVYRFVANSLNMEMGSGELYFKLQKSLTTWIVVYYKRDLEKCLKFAPIWEQLVKLFHENIRFGSVNNPLYSVLKVDNDEQYPIVHFHPSGKKKNKEAEIYNGSLTLEALTEYLDEKLITPIVHQITDITTLEPCPSREFCIFVFIPTLDICRPSCRNGNLELITIECQAHKRNSWIWFWTEYTQQIHLELAFEIDSTLSENISEVTIVVLNVQASMYMKTFVPVDFTMDHLLNITDDISHDINFNYHLLATQAPDVRRVKAWNPKTPDPDEL